MTQQLHEQPITDYQIEYRAAGSIGWQAVGWLLLGSLTLLSIVVRFVLLILAPPKTDDGGISSGLIGGVGVVAVMGITRGIAMLRRPVRATVDGESISIDGFVSHRRIAWGDVAQLVRDKKTEGLSSESVRYVALLDASGRELGRVTESFKGFDELVAQIESRSTAARGQPTLDRDLERNRRAVTHRKKARRQAIICLIAMLFGIAALVGGLYLAYKNHQLRTNGVDAIGHIDRLYMRSVTPWIDYSFNDEAGQRHADKDSLDESKWQQLTGQESVPVRYARADPGWSYVAGKQPESPAIFIGIGVGFTLMMGFLPVLYLMGYSDLSIKDGKFKLKRIGELDEAEFASTGVLRKTTADPPATSQTLTPIATPQPWPPASSGAAVLPYSPPERKTSRLPAGLIAIVACNVLFGLIGLVLNGARLVLLTTFSDQPLTVGQNQWVFYDSLQIRLWAAADLLLAILLLVSAVGIGMLRPWGRKLAIGVAALHILSNIGSVVQVILAAINEPAAVDETARQRVTMSIIGAILGALIGAIYPIVLLVVLGRRSTAERFTRPQAV